MSIYFDKFAVVARVVDRNPSKGYILVENGTPGRIFCHASRRGIGLKVLTSGSIKMTNPIGDVVLPGYNEQVVLVRRSLDPSSSEFFQSSAWVHHDHWLGVCWAVNAQQTYRIVGINHRMNGEPTENHKVPIYVAQGRLIELVIRYPRDSVNDQLGSVYKTHVGRLTFSQENIWERLEADGNWIECDDPRPLHAIITS